jgi:ADP-dependent phosphofructokinase/glucokinase
MALRKENFDDAHERAGTMENSQSSQREQMTIEVNRDLRSRIKAAATRKHITINEYLEQLLDEMVPEIDGRLQSGHLLTQEKLDKLREIREELSQRNNYQHLGNSVEEIRQMREERTRQLMGEDYTDE